MSHEDDLPMLEEVSLTSFGLDDEISIAELGDEISLPFPDLSLLESRCGYTFKNREYLERALTHPSYSNERRRKRKHNQRLEFLGDAVLGLLTASVLYDRDEFEDEGVLTRSLSALVCESALAKKARELELGYFLKLGKGEDSQGGRDRDSILCDAYEALLASIYVDGGFEAAKRVVLKLHRRDFDTLEQPNPPTPNFKGQLQSLIQAKYNVQPTYHIVYEQGPEHRKVFVAEVRVFEERLGQGEGRSKKQAEQAAAQEALENFIEKGEDISGLI